MIETQNNLVTNTGWEDAELKLRSTRVFKTHQIIHHCYVHQNWEKEEDNQSSCLKIAIVGWTAEVRDKFQLSNTHIDGL